MRVRLRCIRMSGLPDPNGLNDSGAAVAGLGQLPYPFRFHAIISPCLEILELLESSIRPVDHDPINGIAFAESKRHRQFRLRQVARPTPHHARAGLATVVDSDHRPDSIPIRLRPNQPEPNAMIAGDAVVPV